MLCPECGDRCSRDEIDNGVGIVASSWACSNCGWDEDMNYPLSPVEWQRYLNDGWDRWATG